MAEVVIAARGGRDAKSRLAAMLSPDDRDTLTTRMLQDMLNELVPAQPAASISVVTTTSGIAVAARRSGAAVISQSEPANVNDAFSLALDAIAERAPYDSVALLMGDLPLIRASDLDAAFLLLGTHAVVLAPASADLGTNAILLRAGAHLPLCFGPKSFERHRAAAEAAGLSTAVIAAESLSFDVDRPEDLTRVMALAPRSLTGRFLRQRFSQRTPS
jgi:2-phospho-L-lactate guanylyltransferase